MAGDTILGFIIWTWVAVSISNDDIHYATSAWCLFVYVFVRVFVCVNMSFFNISYYI